jgi:DNA polymerase III epsilon subunit-like protein
MHLMVDLETLGTDPRSVILSIGAVFFTETEIGKSFYVEAVVDSQQEEWQRKISADTLAWWINQNDVAKRVFHDGPHKQPLAQALFQLQNFIGSEEDTVLVWANGAGFDFPLLHTAYHDIQERAPWRFFNERCYRTVKAMYPGIPKPVTGVAHNALDDAMSQAFHLQAIWQQLR